MRRVQTLVVIGLMLMSLFLVYLRVETLNIAAYDWGPEIQISTDNGTEVQGSPSIAADNGKVHAVWTDYEDGDADIYYRCSLDNGATWEPEQEISNDILNERQGEPDIAVWGDEVHVIWANDVISPEPDPDSDIFYRYFNGTAWQPITEISIDNFVDEDQAEPAIAVDKNSVYAVWYTYAGHNTPAPFDVDVMYTQTKGGLWDTPTEIGNDENPYDHQTYPDIAVYNGSVHVVWVYFAAGDYDIRYRRCDGGNWQLEQEISVDILTNRSHHNPKIAVDNDEIHVVWVEDKHTDVDIYYTRFNGTGWSFPTEVNVDLTGNEIQSEGRIAVEDGYVYLTYTQVNTNNSGDVFFRYFNGISWEPVWEISTDIIDEDQRLSNIAVRNGTIHIVWRGNDDGDNDIYYRRLVLPDMDLKIAKEDIVLSPGETIFNGTSINISATIYCFGDSNASNIKVSFYNGDPDLGGTLICANLTIPFLMHGKNFTVNTTWLPPSSGRYNIFVAVDYPPPGNISEYNEMNNIAWQILEVRDLEPPVLYIDSIGDDIIVNWTHPYTTGLSHYLLYRATSQTDFDFTDVWINTSQHDDNGIIPLRTTWNDTGAASILTSQEYYYTIRAVSESGNISSTSRTVGKWTKTFQSGISTFSLPLEPLQNMTVDYYLNYMNASYIKWMHPGLHTWMKHGEGDVNDTQMKVGEGYVVKFDSQTNYTFTGMPGAMIIYDDDSGFSGFDPDFESKSLAVDVETSGNVTLSWQEPMSMTFGDWYEVYYSSTRDGFFGMPGRDYDIAPPSIDYGTSTTTISGLGANDPESRLYFLVVPFNSFGIRGASTYSIGVWTEEYLAEYDTIGIPLKMMNNNTADWFCNNIPDTLGINYYIHSDQRWGWHLAKMPEGVYDYLLVMTEGYQISTLSATKFTFIGI